MTTTEWMVRYNRAFEEAAMDYRTDFKVDRIYSLPGSFTRLPPVRMMLPLDLPHELLPPGYVELGHGLRVEWDEQNKCYKPADPK